MEFRYEYCGRIYKINENEMLRILSVREKQRILNIEIRDLDKSIDEIMRPIVEFSRIPGRSRDGWQNG